MFSESGWYHLFIATRTNDESLTGFFRKQRSMANQS